ncbi:gluconate 2-dehydrogenase subunit 3-like protein [Chitinophaga skermanii]|uniref:Gluconate 2-dehydrogenase subunit 3-like protein n=1 Tax=Chitinophaga skermanii TaxID=331697 RepID=A0A327QQM0_9BACT|nr:gluconate 2-dehydrogenase subunit 3 family protein [Chitinophaga skermanii]RAJ06886.1 gluconate 2-dehydrogenase subunit 3-like protein [Chitinophaga skermanii]
MNRRDALKNVAILMGTAISASTLAALTGCNSGPKNYTLQTPETRSLVAEICETIIPETSTPGAKAAKVDDFILVMMNDCYDAKAQGIFVDGLKAIDTAADKKYGKTFINLTADQKTELLTEIDKERIAYRDNKDKPKDAGPHYFQIMKELTLLGYFTSEPGATKALRYEKVPGKYEGCIPYNKGDKAWAS